MREKKEHTEKKKIKENILQNITEDIAFYLFFILQDIFVSMVCDKMLNSNRLYMFLNRVMSFSIV